MSGNIDHTSNSDNTPRHGIVCRNCIVRKGSEGGSAVRTVHPGTLVQIYSSRQDNILFCIVRDDMQVDLDQLICNKKDILSVPENLWGPLFAVPKWSRLSIVEDGKLAEALGNIVVGSTVQVLGPDFCDVVCNGTVASRNCITKLGPGVFFGLQIKDSRKYYPSLLKGVSLLEPGTKGFPRNCDLVVSVDKIRPVNSNLSREKSVLQHERETEKQLTKIPPNMEGLNTPAYKTMLVLHLKEKSPNISKKTMFTSSPMTESNANIITSKKPLSSDFPLAVGDEVVYIDESRPEKGVVKWIGLLDNKLKVGVEFENPIGSGVGFVNGVELFRAKYAHAMILPPEALIKLSDYIVSSKKEDSQHKINNIYNNLRSNEICCDKKLAPEETYKMLKSNSHQCLKHPDRTFHITDTFHNKNCDELKLKTNEIYKSECIFSDSYLHHSSRSFDLTKTNEKKLNNRRQCNSIDNEILHVKDHKLLMNLQNSNLSSPKSSTQDVHDLMAWSKHEGCSDDGLQHHEDDQLNHAALSSQIEHINNVKVVQEKEAWDSQYSEQSSSDDSAVCYDIPRTRGSDEELGKGSVVELTYKGEPHYGVIRWVGELQEDRDSRPPRVVAGIEMEEERNGFTDGTFNSKRYFTCNPKKALFIPLHKCRKDSRFGDDHHRQANSNKPNCFGQMDCPVVEGTIPPINNKGELEVICGKNRGIQGHHNSCYLDATLFAMFAFTSVFDSLLYRPPAKQDIPQYLEVQRVLREEIVNPLRKNLFVRADRVMKLRTLLEKLSSVSGLTSEEKDPEEFLNSLLAQILKAEPFLKLSSGQETFHYQLFVEKDERLTFPSVQQLFEQSFVTSDIKLKQIPSCLIIQMPRFGKSFKMYSRILPPQLLDVTDIIEHSPRQCTVCGKLAEYECKDCFGQNGIGNGLESISYCRMCLETAHNHHCRARHNYRLVTVPVEFSELQEHCIIPRLYMELFAVVCIETSHYVAFVKCGSGSEAPWCFFDSMADRKGEQNGYNIPEMVPCPDLPYWLSEDGAKTLNEMRDERQLPEYAKRLFCDAYMCMYQSPDMLMYR